MESMNVSVPGILLAALAFFLVGGLWFSVLFARRWAREAGLSEDQLSSGAVRVFTMAGVMALVVATSMAFFLGEVSIAAGAGIGAVAGLTFAAAPLAMIAAFERRSVALTLIDAGYVVVAFTVAGAIIAAFQ